MPVVISFHAAVYFVAARFDRRIATTRWVLMQEHLFLADVGRL